MGTLYEAAGGEAGLVRLAEAWHARVPADEVVAHAFSHGYEPDHTERLAEELDRRAIACFDEALVDAGLTDEPLRRVLHDYFAWTTTTTMARYHESADDAPAGLRVPRWSWEGLAT